MPGPVGEMPTQNLPGSKGVWGAICPAAGIYFSRPGSKAGAFLSPRTEPNLSYSLVFADEQQTPEGISALLQGAHVPSPSYIFLQQRRVPSVP